MQSQIVGIYILPQRAQSLLGLKRMDLDWPYRGEEMEKRKCLLGKEGKRCASNFAPVKAEDAIEKGTSR